MLHTKYKFIVTEFKSMKNNEKLITICIKDLKTNITVPHPITEFINARYYVSTRSINSLLAPARVIVRFLNYIIYNIDSKDNNFMHLSMTGLNGLNLQHASDYISHLTDEGLARETVLQHDRVLNDFYLYLNQLGYISSKITKEKDKSLFIDYKLQTKYPQRQTTRSKAHKLVDFGKNRYELMNHFLTISLSIAPEISFAICLQFLGGLRRGELVNIMYSNLEVEANSSMIVTVKDNRHILFSHLKETSSEFPKRTNYLSPKLCRQVILNAPILWDMYNHHLKMNPHRKTNQPLFINKDGKAMSGKVYERRFKKVKKAFLGDLKKQRKYEDYNLLNDTIWSTHIGRGNFSNILFDMNLSPTQIAIARGDSNINSSLDYVDEKSTYLVIQDNLELLANLKL